MSVGKKLSVGKKCRAIPNVRTFPGMQDRNTAEAGKKPLGPRGGGRGGGVVGWEKKLSVGKTNVRWNPRDSGFESRRDQYSYRDIEISKPK